MNAMLETENLCSGS